MGWYALGTCHFGEAVRPALILDGHCYDLAEASAGSGLSAPASLDAIIRDWEKVGVTLDRIAARAESRIQAGDLAGKPVAEARFRAPFEPYRLFGAASNYIEHAAEMQTKLAAKRDSTPFIFLKSQSSVIGPEEPILLPPESQKVDWEVELGVVIGRRGRRIPASRAPSHIAGYVVVNDISARDLTRRSDFPFSHDWFRGKSFDSFTPVGPWFVPRDCLGDPHGFRLTLTVNGEIMQDGSSADMIFNSFEQIAYLSNLLELRPGDLLATGTPAGVGMGRGLFLKHGDRVVAGIDGIGAIGNPVLAEAR